MPLQQWAHRLGIGRRHGHRPAGREPGPAPDAEVARRPVQARADADRPPVVRRATTSTCPSARATCRPTRSRWRWPTPRSPTAGACCGRGSGCGSRTPPAARSSSSTRRPPAALKISPETRNAILEGLHGAASAPGGTSTPVFEGFPIPIAGKTGTAEHVGKADQSWYVALAPYPNPRYVVAVTDEAGGFGADTAAPMARRILAALFDVKETGPRAGRRGARLMQASAATAVKDFRDDARGALPAHRPADAARHARADRGEHLHRRQRHPGRHPGRPQLLPLPAGRATRPSGSC